MTISVQEKCHYDDILVKASITLAAMLLSRRDSLHAPAMTAPSMLPRTARVTTFF